RRGLSSGVPRAGPRRLTRRLYGGGGRPPRRRGGLTWGMVAEKSNQLRRKRVQSPLEQRFGHSPEVVRAQHPARSRQAGAGVSFGDRRDGSGERRRRGQRGETFGRETRLRLSFGRAERRRDRARSLRRSR